MTIAQDVLKSEAPGYIELFEIDCSSIGHDIYRLTNSHSSCSFGVDNTPEQNPLVYTPFPLIITGIESNTDGAPARPRLEVGNLRGIDGSLLKLFGYLAFENNDLVGIKVTYIRTFTSYLNLSSRISAPPLKYFVAKKLSHNRLSISFELRSPLDKERAFLPKRQMLKRDFPGLSVNKHIG